MTTAHNYNEAKANCWARLCKTEPALSLRSSTRIIFNAIFKCAYALGIQSRINEEKEVLTVSRIRVQDVYAKALHTHNSLKSSSSIADNRSRAIDISIGKMQALEDLFGSKCLPYVDSSEPLFQNSPENCNNENYN